jgi:hypothetical protein
MKKPESLKYLVLLVVGGVLVTYAAAWRPNKATPLPPPVQFEAPLPPVEPVKVEATPPVVEPLPPKPEPVVQQPEYRPQQPQYQPRRGFFRRWR